MKQFQHNRLNHHGGHRSPSTAAVVLTSASFRFVENEILLMKYLGNHPNLLCCHGFTMSPGTMNLVLEYAPFGSLANILYDKKFLLEIPPALFLAWFTDFV
jgi:hypothetical protein